MEWINQGEISNLSAGLAALDLGLLALLAFVLWKARGKIQGERAGRALVEKSLRKSALNANEARNRLEGELSEALRDRDNKLAQAQRDASSYAHDMVYKTETYFQEVVSLLQSALKSATKDVKKARERIKQYEQAVPIYTERCSNLQAARLAEREVNKKLRWARDEDHKTIMEQKAQIEKLQDAADERTAQIKDLKAKSRSSNGEVGKGIYVDKAGNVYGPDPEIPYRNKRIGGVRRQASSILHVAPGKNLLLSTEVELSPDGAASLKL